MTETTSAPKGSGVKGALTRKLGPLPVWGWAVAIGGSVILFRIVTGKGAFPQAQAQPSGGGGSGVAAGPIIPGSENSSIGNLSASDLAALRNLLAPAAPAGGATPPPTVASSPINAYQEARRVAYDYAQKLFQAGKAPNPGSFSTWAAGLDASGKAPDKYNLTTAYNYAQAQFAEGKAPNPGSFATWSNNISDVLVN